MLLVAFIMTAVMGASSAFSTSYVMFAVSRALCGVALSGLSIIGNVLSKKFLQLPFQLNVLNFNLEEFLILSDSPKLNCPVV